MSEKTNFYNSKTWKALSRAVDTFERLSEALQAKCEFLIGRKGAPDVDEGQLTKEILVHQGAWKMVKDALAKFREDQREKGGVGKDGIDFGQAREEVRGRIARLVARGAGREVS